jgi:hypothetical protein
MAGSDSTINVYISCGEQQVTELDISVISAWCLLFETVSMVYVVVIWNMAWRWIFRRHIGKSFARLIMRNFTFLTLMEHHQVGVPNHPTLEHHNALPWVES